MRGAMLGMVTVCAGVAGSVGAGIVVDGGSGWASTDTAWGGKVRNMTYTNGDWEMALGQSPGSFALHRHTEWQASGGVNTFALTYSNVTGDIDLTWNGDTLSWNDADRANSLAIQLLARGRSGGDADYGLRNLSFNGDAIDLGAAAIFADAGTNSANGSASYILLGGASFAELDEWTVSGELLASWSGSTPSRDLSRIEFIASTRSLDIPTPAGLALFGATALAVAPRRRR